MEIGLFPSAQFPALAWGFQHRSRQSGSPGAGAAGLGKEWGTVTPMGMWASDGDKRHLNCSSLRVDVVRFGGSFAPARRGFGVLSLLLPKPFCATCHLPCCRHVVSSKTFLIVGILFCLWHQREVVPLHPLKSVSKIQNAYLITLDLASAGQLLVPLLQQLAQK